MTIRLCALCVKATAYAAARITITSYDDSPRDLRTPDLFMGMAPGVETMLPVSGRPDTFIGAVRAAAALPGHFQWRINTINVNPTETVLYRGTEVCAGHMGDVDELDATGRRSWR